MVERTSKFQIAKKFVGKYETPIVSVATVGYVGSLGALSRFTSFDEYRTLSLSAFAGAAVFSSVCGAAIRMRTKPSDFVKDIGRLTLHVTGKKRIHVDGSDEPPEI